MSPKFSICLTDLAELEINRAFSTDIDDRGFYGVFLPENSHVPVSRPRTVKPFENIERLSRFYDPYPCLAALSVLTENIKIGTSVCLLPQRQLNFLAHSVWSLQQMASNRFIMGVAGGFIREAMENHGAEFPKRWEIVENSVKKLRGYWMSNCASKFDALAPPIWIGSNSKAVPKRVASYGDGWMTRKSLYPGDAIEDMKHSCDEVGRNFSDISMVSMDASLDIDEIFSDSEAGYGHFVYFVSGNEAVRFKKLETITRLVQYFS